MKKLANNTFINIYYIINGQLNHSLNMDIRNLIRNNLERQILNEISELDFILHI